MEHEQKIFPWEFPFEFRPVHLSTGRLTPHATLIDARAQLVECDAFEETVKCEKKNTTEVFPIFFFFSKKRFKEVFQQTIEFQFHLLNSVDYHLTVGGVGWFGQERGTSLPQVAWS